MCSSDLKFYRTNFKFWSFLYNSWVNLKEWNQQFLYYQLIIYLNFLFMFLFFRFFRFTIFRRNRIFWFFDCHVCWIWGRNKWLNWRFSAKCIFRFYLLFFSKILTILFLWYNFLLLIFLWLEKVLCLWNVFWFGF